MTDHTKNPNQDTASQPVQPGMTGTSNEGIAPEGNFSNDPDGQTEALDTTDIEGASFDKAETQEAPGFVGGDGQDDTSSELVEDRDASDQGPDGQ